VLVRQGKGQKDRRIALPAQARKELQAYLDVRPQWPTDRLCFSHSGQPLQTRDVERLVEKLARLAGIESKVTPHTLRHTFATRFLRDGGDLATLQSLLGHANLTTTARYLHPDAERVQEMVEGL
jgi:site-specific recombinase XerD